jgi:hypothetical protein
MTPAFDATQLTRPLDRRLALEIFSTLGEQAQALSVTLRAPPPEPTSCCGRGCNGCVWEGFLDAASFWRDDAWHAIQDAR